jgi:hypothetical protein
MCSDLPFDSFARLLIKEKKRRGRDLFCFLNKRAEGTKH